MILCCLLTSVISDEKITRNLHCCSPVCGVSPLTPSTAFKIFSSSLVFTISTKMCVGMLFFAFILLVVCWDSWINMFHQIVESIYTSLYFPHVLVLQACWAVWPCPVGFWGFVHFPSNLIIFTDLSPSSLTLPSVITKLLLSPFSEWTIWFWNFYLVLLKNSFHFSPEIP